MRYHPLLLIGGFAGMLLLTAGALDNNGKAGRTGAPGEQTCRDGCHSSYALNSGTGSINLTSSNMTYWEYVPGVVYHMSVTVSLASSNLFGVGVECLTASNTNAGTLTITDAASTQIKNATVSGTSRRNVVHQLNGGAGQGSKTFNFDWVAPATNVGNVTFYFAGNASNGQNNEAGDYIYTGTRVISPAAGVGMEEADWSTDDLVLAPNPMTDNISVSYSNEAGGPVDIALYDLNGHTVHTRHLEQQAPGRHTLMLTDLGLAQGTYMVYVNTPGKSFVQRLVSLGH